MIEPMAPRTIERYRLQVDSGQDLDQVQARILLGEVERLHALYNTPELLDFWEGAKREAIHQRERWGDDHDRQKGPHDWIAVIVHLAGKCVRAFWDRDTDKALHHIVTIAAVAANWHARATGIENDGRMHPIARPR